MISTVEGGAFSGLTHLTTLDLGRNRLSKFNSDVFHGAENLEKLDLSENFIADFPTVALKSFAALRHLNLSSNMIKVNPQGFAMICRIFSASKLTLLAMQFTMELKQIYDRHSDTDDAAVLHL